MAGEPVSLDPSQVEDGLGFRVIVNLMDGLYGYTNAGELVPSLAESYEASKDLKTWTFTLKPGVKWSDGVPVEADQFITAIERALDPKTGSKLSGLLRNIEGAEKYIAKKAPHVSGLEAKGNKLWVRLERPEGELRQTFTLPITYPLRKDILEKTKGNWDLMKDPSIPTLGFYVLESFQRGQALVLRAAKPLPDRAPKKILFRIVREESTAGSLFEQGKLDFVNRVPAYDWDRYRQEGYTHSVPFLATYFLGFNLKKPPFNDRDFRRAVAGAIRKKELTNALGSGEKPAYSWIPEGLPGFQPFQSDREGLDARFQDSVSRVRMKRWDQVIELGFDASSRNALVLEKVQADLQARLGWKVVLKNQEWKTFVKSIYISPTAIFRHGWSTPTKDPLIFISPFGTNDPFSFTKTSDAKIDRRISEIRSLPEGPARTEAILAAEKWIVEDEALVVPLYHYVSAYLLSPRVEKLEINPFGHTRYDEVRLKRGQ